MSLKYHFDYNKNRGCLLDFHPNKMKSYIRMKLFESSAGFCLQLNSQFLSSSSIQIPAFKKTNPSYSLASAQVK